VTDETEARLAENPDARDEQAALVARLRRQDEAAYDEFVRRHSGRMLATARRLLRSDDDAADAVQEAFISAFRGIDRFEGTSRLATWLHRIVVNACLMKLRSRSRQPAVSIETLLPAFNSWGHHARGVAAWRKLPVDELLTGETRALVRRCIDMLPEDFRTILLLRDIEELSTEEAAAVLDITAGAAKVRLHRARQALRTLLEPHFAK
jgi:RNA polymerase sigma-70 factor (ECF subfamily)